MWDMNHARAASRALRHRRRFPVGVAPGRGRGLLTTCLFLSFCGPITDGNADIYGRKVGVFVSRQEENSLVSF